MDSIMISVNPPYACMIAEEIKKTEFRSNIIGAVSKGTTAYIYETKNKGGRGKVIAKAQIVEVMRLGTAEAKECIYRQYIEIAERLGLEVSGEGLGWYLESIGYGATKYGIVLNKITGCNHNLDEFECKGSTMLRPPQNMCSCTIKRRKRDGNQELYDD